MTASHRTLVLTACWRQARFDTMGTLQDADEVEALTAYMELVYVCPSLTRPPTRTN